MKRGVQLRKNALRRYLVYRMKLMELIHFYLLWSSLNENAFYPENSLGQDGPDFADSLRTACLSWYCTIVDQSSDGLNIFELWRLLFPRHLRKIDRVWSEVEPEWEVLREFRDKCGFHADTANKYFAARQRVRETPKCAKALQRFLTLAIFFLRKEDQELPDFVSEVEECLLNVELGCNVSVNRDRFKRLLILPRGNYKRLFGR